MMMAPTPLDADRSSPASRLAQLLRAVRRHRRLFLSVALPLPVLVCVVSLFATRTYRAGASFMPQEPNSPPVGLGALVTQFGLGGGARAATNPQFYADLLVSKTVLRAVVLTEFEVPGARPFRGTLLDYYRESDPDREKALLNAIKKLDQRLLVTTNRTTGVVSLEVRTRSREFSVAIVQRFLELLNDFNLNRRRSAGKTEREFLDQRVAIAESSLVQQEEQLATFLSRNRSTSNSPELQAARGRIERRVTLRQQALTGLTQALEAARTDEIRNTPVITVVERPEDSVEPVNPLAVAKTLIALMAGVALALFAVYTREGSGPAR